MGNGTHGLSRLHGLMRRARALPLLLTLALAACGPVATASNGSTNSVTPSSTPPITSPLPTATLPPAAPVCQIAQTAAQFRTGSPATGNTTGEILLRNVSSSACALQGNVDFYGVDAQGQRIAASGMNQPQTLAPVVLPPHTPAEASGVSPAPGAYLIMLVIGAFRDDPTAPNGLCSAANEVTPSQFVISVGAVSLRVTNYYPGVPGFSAIEGCHGKIFAGNAFLS